MICLDSMKMSYRGYVMELSVGLIWVNTQNETTFSRDDLSPLDESLEDHLNDMACYWENPGIDEVSEIEFPEDWGEPIFQAEDGLRSDKFYLGEEADDCEVHGYLDESWLKLSKSYSENNVYADAIVTPWGMSPLDWHELSEQMKLLELGFRDSSVME